MKKTALITTAILSTMIISGAYAAEDAASTTGSGTETTSTTETTNTDNKVINLEYSVENGVGKFVTKKEFTYSVDKYLYFDLQDGSFDKIKNMEVKLNGKTEKTNVVYVCSSDENIMEISFEKYKEKVNKIEDSNKKTECKNKFIYAITDAGTTDNTFKFNTDDTVIEVEFNDKNSTDNPFSKIEIRNADNELVNTFDIKNAEQKEVAKPVEKKPTVEPKKEEKKVVNTKKTGLGTNILLALLLVILLSAYNIKKRIS